MGTTAKVTWKEGLSFEGKAGSGFTMPLGARSYVGGAEDGFGPMELLATGLAGCTAMDVISILQKKRQNITDFEVNVNADRAEEHPKVFTKAVIEYLVTGHGVDESAVVRAIELSVTRYCSAHAMFKKIIPISLEYSIYEDQEDGSRKQVAKGSYTLPEEAR
ncbi:MAG: OsmC family protein [Anaerolineales bacterium]